MKHIYVNFKRFDVPAELGGVNRLATMNQWAQSMLKEVIGGLEKLADQADFAFFFPEAHLLSAVEVAIGTPAKVGCQSVHWEDVAPGGNFGAFTSMRPAAAMKAMGCQAAIIGHCEERRALSSILSAGGCESKMAVNEILAKRVQCAINQELEVLYCIGETADEQDHWQEVLKEQLDTGLANADKSKVVIAYEPVWAIGPGKTPPDADYIRKIASFIKEETGGMDVVYGGGLKADNAAMLAGIKEIDGGLIALTRFSGEIGFYPAEYLEIARLYLNHEEKG